MNNPDLFFLHPRYESICNIPEFGPLAKKQLQNAKILLIGMGGLGTPCALYLAAAGVGTLGICEQDFISANNLSRQILFDPTMIGLSKRDQACQKLLQINPEISLQLFENITSANAKQILPDFDFVIDATDNIVSKLLINDTCVQINKPFSYAGVIKTKGLCFTVVPGKSLCCRCVFPELSAATNVAQCSQEGIFPPVAGILGLVQATEAIKFCTQTGSLLTNRVFSIEILHWNTRIFDVSQHNPCNLCTIQKERAFLDSLSA